MLKLAIIADDMTGLNAIASEFQRFGLRVRTFAKFMDVSRVTTLGYDVVGVDTNSRTISPDAAHAAVLSAAQTLAELSPQIIMKQTDSSLHGNVAAELCGALEATSDAQLIFAPACPSLGRITKGGVHGVQDGSKNSAQDIKKLLSDTDGITFSVAATGETLQAPQDTRQILVCDASTDYDLDLIVSEALSTGSSLFGGSVGLAKALARHLWANQTCIRLPAFLVLGSFQNRTRTQCEVLMQTGTAELIKLSEDNGDLPAVVSQVFNALKAGRHAVLMTSTGAQTDLGKTGYPFLDDASRARIETGIRYVVRDVMAGCCDLISGMVLAGGATTAIVTRDVLPLSGFDDVSYIDDGVAAGIGLISNGGTIPFVTKAGNWGDDDVLLPSILWLQTAKAQISNLEKRSYD